MKLSWRDIVTTALFILGGAVVYAKVNDYAWVILDSWRSAVALLAVIGLTMIAVNGFDTANRSWFNIGTMSLGAIAGVIVVIGMFVASSLAFYSAAILSGIVWAAAVGSHIRHSMLHDTGSMSRHTIAHQ